ncbi:MAG: 50S ribosomal protein L19 [Verrucomicrobia bacterium]|nr:50S ribosomal protein L19 [Verrucomicrobiota bacterium]
MNLLDKVSNEQLKKDVSSFRVGDTVKVHTRVVEGDKERIQIFQGVVIARKGSSVNANFTVRRISYGEGVERVFPLHSPKVAKIEVEREGAPRRAKLYYLRGRTGKDALFVKERKTTSAKKGAAAGAEAKAPAKKAKKAAK